MTQETKKLAKLLRTPEEVIFNLEGKMNRITGKQGVIDKISGEIEEKTGRQLKEMGLSLKSSPEEVYQSLLDKIKEVDQNLFKHFGSPDFSKKEDYQKILKTIKDLVGNLKGFYLKPEKAKELFRKNPPGQIMKGLGYDDIEQMLEKEDIFELFSALRFAEDKEWMNEKFFVPFKDLTKNDFEEREIRVMVLNEKWVEIGEKFSSKKLHHMSHLKEMGIVFVIPIKETNPGETLYLLFMTLHYISEVDWYSRLFKSYSPKDGFSEKMAQALKVKTSSGDLADNNWRIMPGYLAKDDLNDPRLFAPHINLESLFYLKVSKIISRFSEENPDLRLNSWVNSENSARIIKEKLISFDLFDNGVAFLGKVNFNSRYIYHQQEALWNEIFIQYFNEEELDKVLMENLSQGFIVVE